MPQGLVLGPSLLLCYLVMLPECISEFTKNNKSCIFADDINLPISSKNLNDAHTQSKAATQIVRNQLANLNHT